MAVVRLEVRSRAPFPFDYERVDGTVTFPAGDEEAPARLAADLLARATPGIAALFDGP